MAAATPMQLSRVSLLFRRLHPLAAASPPRRLSLLRPQRHRKLFFSTTKTPYPLQYDMIISRPVHPSRPRPRAIPEPSGSGQPEPDPTFSGWVDEKLASNRKMEMDKSKRKYYNKRRKRLLGSSSSEDEDDGAGKRNDDNNLVEIKQEVVELRTLHKREEELYFHDAFAYPWEKDKHYKMVYQLEKKYFPDQCFDKAFLEPGQVNEDEKKMMMKKKKSSKNVKNDDENGEETKGLVFFEEESGVEQKKDVKDDVTEKKVEEFFKCLKKVPNEKNGDVVGAAAVEPFLSSRRTGLPPRWDSPAGTALLVNKPKGWTSFTVCGKLRRLVKVKKVGHAGTLDPMATGLLIVCVGKATKVVDRYQGMIKGYSGIFRLGEATSTWDADSPVIQRESWEHIKDEDLKKTAATFCGEIWQVPPMFSAIKVGGEKMYEKARRGESMELSPRRISIFQFDVERSLDDRQNVIFRVICSKGTYIRSLCADFGKALSSCAHLTALRRDSIGEYLADDAWEFQELEEAITKGYM